MITLKVKDMEISTGGPLIVYIHKKDADKFDFHTSDRVKVIMGRKITTAAIDIIDSAKTLSPGRIGLSEEVLDMIGAVHNRDVKIEIAGKPLSIEFIKKKLDGMRLSKDEIEQIVWDIVNRKLTTIELTYFVAACYSKSMTMKETAYLTKAILQKLLKVHH